MLICTTTVTLPEKDSAAPSGQREAIALLESDSTAISRERKNATKSLNFELNLILQRLSKGARGR